MANDLYNVGNLPYIDGDIARLYELRDYELSVVRDLAARGQIHNRELYDASAKGVGGLTVLVEGLTYAVGRAIKLATGADLPPNASGGAGSDFELFHNRYERTNGELNFFEDGVPRNMITFNYYRCLAYFAERETSGYSKHISGGVMH